MLHTSHISKSVRAGESLRGFTLIETLFSIFIFSVSIVALLSITAGGVADSNFIKKKQTAYLLAQEGIELVRYARDTEMRFGGDWVSFRTGMSPCTSALPCTIDTYILAQTGSIANAMQTCPSNVGCPFLKQNNTASSATAGFYQYIDGQETDFKRSINLGLLKASPEAQITSTVTWEHGGEEYSIELEEFITGWVRPLPGP